MSASPSYLAAFLRHPNNGMALLAAGCAAIFASIPYGWEGMALVGVVALGIEVLAALAIPDLPSFRAAVDRTQAGRMREQRRASLLAELDEQGGQGGKAVRQTYEQMRSRVLALMRTAAQAGGSLSVHDVEKLDDLCVDYLGMSALHLSLGQRKEGLGEDALLKRIAALQTQIKNNALSDEEERQLRAAQSEYTEAAERARRMAVRRSVLEATLVSMPDKLEELYQLVMASPYAKDMGSKIEDSLSRLRIAEEVAAEFDDSELDAIESPLTRGDSRTKANATLGQISRQQAARRVGAIKQ
ncbi:MAG: hypothetical protein IPH08_07790 [Rhodocyclaceae bacterium]|nr:hypothetical protein [Rhodocyclaceae bacterium]